MRHTKQVNLDAGGAIFVTYDSHEEDFEQEMGDILLDEGGLR